MVTGMSADRSLSGHATPGRPRDAVVSPQHSPHHAATSAGKQREIAPGVCQVTVGDVIPTHVYVLDTADGPVVFDSGPRGSGAMIAAAVGGAISRVVLSHSHVDHRGGAPELGAPVACHPEEVPDATGDAGRRYLRAELICDENVRAALATLIEHWDGGPVAIADTVSDGDLVGDFAVVHTPGHSPGHISLYREADGLLLAGDAIYTFDVETGAPSAPRVPHTSGNWDTPRARDSVARLAALGPRSVWPGHALPLIARAALSLSRAAEAP
jgi:glyoxylase-like metal-dependent hydrolase (beta-lactamase superfamily II)